MESAIGTVGYADRSMAIHPGETVVVETELRLRKVRDVTTGRETVVISTFDDAFPPDLHDLLMKSFVTVTLAQQMQIPPSQDQMEKYYRIDGTTDGGVVVQLVEHDQAVVQLIESWFPNEDISDAMPTLMHMFALIGDTIVENGGGSATLDVASRAITFPDGTTIQCSGEYAEQLWVLMQRMMHPPDEGPSSDDNEESKESDVEDDGW